MTPAYSAHVEDSHAAIASVARLEQDRLRTAESRRSTGTNYETHMGGMAVRAYRTVPNLWQIHNLLRTVETAAPTLPEVPLPGLLRLAQASKAFSESELNEAAYAEAVKLLDTIQAAKIDNVPVPDIGVGEDEISFSWSKDSYIALLSVEGDGEAAYTYHVGERFQPGREVFRLADRSLPDDLREYLRGMYA